jgi:hypothetical protein
MTNVYDYGTKEEYAPAQDISMLRAVTGLAFGGGLIRTSLGVLPDPSSTNGSHDGGTHFSVR